MKRTSPPSFLQRVSVKQHSRDLLSFHLFFAKGRKERFSQIIQVHEERHLHWTVLRLLTALRNVPAAAGYEGQQSDGEEKKKMKKMTIN